MARVILLEKIHVLGDLGDQVSVRNGYARNYLIPQGKAVSANKETIAQFELKRAEWERLAKERLQAAQARATALSELVLTVPVKVIEEGRLYGSIGIQDLVRLAQEAGCELEKSEVRLPNGSLRQLGEYEILVQLHTDVIATLKVNIIAEE